MDNDSTIQVSFTIMNASLDVAKQIKDLLTEIRKDNPSENDARYALDKDIEYIEKCVAILSSNDTEGINDLWREVQYFSRFFGGDYAQRAKQKTLLALMDEFETALLDDIVAMRAKL
jgi:hypothetical protein